ncbi:MAG TPA: hypothetical protein VN222_08445 [Novosphingobium sp.]|nr:hypothetical protein [Novosphingobium sp.]
MQQFRRRFRLAGVALAALACNITVAIAPLHAEDSPDTRLRKLESEVSALQRKVFPGGDGRYFPAPAGAAAEQAAPLGTPSTTAVTDLLTRMDAVEAQNARLTAQIEELSNRLRQLEARTAPPPADTAAAPQAGDTPPAAAASAPVQAAPLPAPMPAPAPRPAAKPAPAPAAAAPVNAKPSAQRVAGVKAIVKPQTADAGEDEYTYGYKLWEAKFYPEAAQQLKLYLDKYPRHRRVSYARNLLGRAYLDDGKPRDAAPWFLMNYQTNKRGERAADSLLLLAEAMIEMKDTNRACIALAQFADDYKAEAAGRLKGQFDQTRSEVTCN